MNETKNTTQKEETEKMVTIPRTMRDATVAECQMIQEWERQYSTLATTLDAFKAFQEWKKSQAVLARKPWKFRG